MEAIWRPRCMAMARWIRSLSPVSLPGSRQMASLASKDPNPKLAKGEGALPKELEDLNAVAPVPSRELVPELDEPNAGADPPKGEAAATGIGNGSGSSRKGNHNWQECYKSMYYDSLVFQTSIDCPLKIRPMRILHQPDKETLFMPHYISVLHQDNGDWLREVLHPCYRDICIKQRVIDPEYDDPLKWPGRPLNEQLIKALEKAASISASVAGTIYHPSFGVVLSDVRAQVYGRSTLVSTGVDVFSVPIKTAMYGAVEYLGFGESENEMQMDVTINQDRFMAGATCWGVSPGDAAISYLEDLKRGIRPGVLLHRFNVCKENICWFMPMQKALRLRQLHRFDSLPRELPVLLREMGLPEEEIAETCTEPLTYKMHVPRTLVVEVIPADGGYNPEICSAVTREAERHKDSSLILFDCNPRPGDFVECSPGAPFLASPMSSPSTTRN